MDLISPEYASLNRELLTSRNDYGTGSFRWSQKVEELRDELGADTVLDYGCGRGTLGVALGRPKWFSEYDPGVPGKDAPPEKQSDLVVVTDVLEHIEPEKLSNVLDNIRTLAKKGVFVSIALKPSTKTLADGRNAHLIVKDQAWWRAELERYFKIVSWSASEGEIIAVLRRLHLLGDIKVISAVSETIRFEQALRNCQINKRRIYIQPRHEKRAVIVGFGPSLVNAASEIAFEQKELGATVVTVSGAHDFLISKGIIPDIHIECDPRQHKAFFTRNPHPKVKYWIASCCHPTLIDQLASHDLTLWHVHNGDEDMRIINEIDLDGFLVQGGGSVGCRAVNVMFTQGYRSFSCYGMDCSFGKDGEQHAGPHSGKTQRTLLARCGDSWYTTSGTMVAIAKSFIENQKVLEQVCAYYNEPAPYDGCHIETIVHGDGLLLAMIREGTRDMAVNVPDEDQAAYTKEAASAA